MLNGPKDKNGKEPQKRFCVECGFQGPNSRYCLGTEIIVEGRRWVFCKECKAHSGEVGCVGSGMDARCHGNRECGEICQEKKVKVTQRRREREECGWGTLRDVMVDLAENLKDWMCNEYFGETHD
jgi:hypothetical protein